MTKQFSENGLVGVLKPCCTSTVRSHSSLDGITPPTFATRPNKGQNAAGPTYARQELGATSPTLAAYPTQRLLLFTPPVFFGSGNRRSTNYSPACDDSTAHVIPPINDYPVATGAVNIVRPILKRPYKKDVMKIYMNVPAGVGKYMTGIISRPPKHHILADFCAGPVVGDDQSLRSNLWGRHIRGSVSADRRVLNMKSADIARRVTLNAVCMVTPYSDSLEPTAIDSKCSSSRYPHNLSRFYATTSQRIIPETDNSTIISGQVNAGARQRQTLQQFDRRTANLRISEHRIVET